MNLSETTLSTESIYKGRIIDLYKDEVSLPNGNRAFREVVRHPGGVCVCAITDGGEVFLVKQFRYPHGKAILEIPAGKLEYGENPLECGKRELLEETGYAAKEFVPLGELLPTPAYCGEVIHMYLARDLEFKAQKLDADEFLEVLKLPFSDAVNMIVSGEITDAKTQAAILKAKVIRERSG